MPVSARSCTDVHSTACAGFLAHGCVSQLSVILAAGHRPENVAGTRPQRFSQIEDNSMASIPTTVTLSLLLLHTCSLKPHVSRYIR